MLDGPVIVTDKLPTLTDLVTLALHPYAFFPVRVYTVAEAGVAVMVVAREPVLQVYESAP